MAAKKDAAGLTYKGLPLVRSKNFLYYGDPSQTHIIFLTILSTDDDGIPNKVQVQLLLTDESLPPMERLLKSGEKNGLYDALDIGSVWLARALKAKA